MCVCVCVMVAVAEYCQDCVRDWEIESSSDGGGGR